MVENEFYSQLVHGPYKIFNIGDIVLERGGTLRQCELAYTTFGVLNATKDNVILVTTWFAGSNKIMERAYIGPGHALDPEKYFVVVVNQIGAGLSTSPHNTSYPLGIGNFPQVTVGDDVTAQERLLRRLLGVEELALVVGGSMGAQQVYEWAVRFPEKVRRAAPIAGTAKTTPHNRLYVAALADAIMSDPAWEDGWYREAHFVRDGLRRHSRLWAVMGLSAGLLKTELANHRIFVARRLPPELPRRLFPANGPEQSALHGSEMAGRRRQSPHRGRPGRGARSHQGQDDRDADQQRHVLRHSGLRSRAGADPRERLESAGNPMGAHRSVWDGP
jgi:homoserine acetyltransferase